MNMLALIQVESATGGNRNEMNLRTHQAIAALLTIVLLVGAFGSFNVNAQRRSRGFHRGPHHSRAKGALIGAGAGLLGGALIGGRKGALMARARVPEPAT